LYDDVLNWPLSWNLMVNYVFFNELSFVFFRVCISNMNFSLEKVVQLVTMLCWPEWNWTS
jgi:hypothetical protein